jgi:hypothetical protein
VARASDRAGPGPDDGVAAWFAPSIAGRLEKAKLRTLGIWLRESTASAPLVVVRARRGRAEGGAHPRLAAAVRAFNQHCGSAATLPCAHAATTGAAREGRGQATAIVPFEKFLLPAELDGSDGRFPGALAPVPARGQKRLTRRSTLGSRRSTIRTAPSDGDAPRLPQGSERLLLWAIPSTASRSRRSRSRT